MTPALRTNLCDAAIGDATPRVREILNLLGQDSERGYRRALDCLLRADGWFDTEPNKAERAVQVLNFVVLGIDEWKHEKLGPLSEDKKADLVGFFIQRVRHS